jgi:adenosylhomocysteine nucleosidase
MILTGDSFFIDKVATSKLIDEHFKDDNVMCLDMESTALAQAAYNYNIPYLAIRAISDIIGGSNQSDDYDNNLERACLESNIFLIELLKSL